MVLTRGRIITLFVLVGVVIAFDIWYFLPKLSRPRARAARTRGNPRPGPRSPFGLSPGQTGDREVDVESILRQFREIGDDELPGDPSQVHNPFLSQESNEAAKLTDDEAGSDTEKEITLLDSDFHLSAIIAGPHGRVAIINGEAYREHDRIDGATIAHITKGEVLLTHEGQQRTLTLFPMNATTISTTRRPTESRGQGS